MNAVPAIFSAVRLADGRWTLVGLDPERPCGPLCRSLPYSAERVTTRIDPELGRQVVVKVEAGASRRSSEASAS
ncbi:MAG: hypothetical protein WAN05_00190 [Roseiarcus sp.]